MWFLNRSFIRTARNSPGFQNLTVCHFRQRE
jgi:hypothetical protein